MAGILNKKQRILDGLITTAGRKQIAEGELRIEFATFTDGGTFYSSDDGTVANDAAERIYFEAADLPRDNIILETDNDGELEVFRGDQFTIFNGTPYLTGSQSPSTGSLNLVTEEVINFSFNNFNSQNIIGTRIPYREKIDQTFTTSLKNIEFNISDEMSFIDDMWLNEASLENFDDLFNNKIFGHVEAFKFLEPRHLLQSQQHPAPESQKLANYSNISSGGFESIDELYQMLSRYPYQEITFPENSSESNMLGQIMFYNDKKFGKLVCVDVGEFDNSDPQSIGSRVYFVGKVYRDRIGNLKFVNIFTLVFE